MKFDNKLQEDIFNYFTSREDFQSYHKFEPQIDDVLDEVECKMYLKTI